MSELKIKEIEVYSEKYDIHGIIRNYGKDKKLFFTYKGKNVEMGLHDKSHKNRKIEDIGRDAIEAYILYFA